MGSGDGKVYALSASSGSKLWSYTTSNWVYSSPAVVNGVVYVGSQDGNVYALGASVTLSPSQSPIVPEIPGQMLGIALFVSIIIALSAAIVAKKRRNSKNIT